MKPYFVLVSFKKITNFLVFCLIAFKINAQSTDVVILDENFPNKNGLLASIPIQVDFFELSSTKTLPQVLTNVINPNSQVTNIHLFCNTDSESITIGNTKYPTDTLDEYLNELTISTTNDINLLVYSCSLAKSAKGVALLNVLATKTNMNVASSSSCETIDEDVQFNFSTSPLTTTINTLFK